VVHAALADGPVVDVQGHHSAGSGLGRVGGELHAHVHLAGRQRLLGLLPVDEHAHHRVGVGELAVLDEE
jgi:hypothetical protein